MDLAEFSGTTLYAGRCRHRRHGLIEVLGYQNTPVNRADGPNAMLLAADATLIPAALTRVPERRRPDLDPALMEFYAAFYPGHTIAVCCFDGADAHRAKPLLMWYEPADPDRLVVPAVDCHTGGPPRLDEPVTTDHWVIFGGDGLPRGRGNPVGYPRKMRGKLRECLPDRVIGRRFDDAAALNGDFAITLDDLREENLDGIHRPPPADTAR
ncbi:hypothetical protein [Actinomadura sp. 7K507]|uniref:hypothetical protein n=1 Tax=Actinomadura sp. 7K507 TaxID=2530365 RepID=UPI001FB59134|nr:hypothetical protein [Actinomadura sp. 7K507]